MGDKIQPPFRGLLGVYASVYQWGLCVCVLLLDGDGVVACLRVSVKRSPLSRSVRVRSIIGMQCYSQRSGGGLQGLLVQSEVPRNPNLPSQ